MNEEKEGEQSLPLKHRALRSSRNSDAVGKWRPLSAVTRASEREDEEDECRSNSNPS